MNESSTESSTGSSNGSSPSVYLAYHQEAPLVRSRHLTPIQVGRADRAPIPLIDGDDVGDNISDRNRAYCEMTAVYWAWKNDTTSSHVGLMHYRRLFDFGAGPAEPPAERFIERIDLSEYEARADEWIESQLGRYDIVCPVPHTMAQTVEQNYLKAHRAEDWDLLKSIIAERYEWIQPAFDKVINSNEIVLANMFIMRRPVFEEFCEFVFPILDAIYDADVDRRYYSAYDTRNVGFVAERLLTTFITHVQDSRPELAVTELNILNLSKATVVPFANPGQFVSTTDVNIALASDEVFVPHTAVMLRSLAEHCNPSRTYNLFLLSSEISPPSLDSLRSMLAPWTNIHLNVIPMNKMFDDSYRSKTRAPSNATYNRLLLFQLFPTLDRLLYIDADMVVLCDVAEIFDFDIDDHQVAAVPDYIMTRTVTTTVATRDPNVPDLGEYQRTTLGLSTEQAARYFNAGLILFNLAAMDPIRVGKDLLGLAASGGFLFRDQDILNSYFKDSYLPLPAQYNVFNSPEIAYGKVPEVNRQAALAAKRDPKIIHYASGEFKPWSNAGVEFSGLYWKYLLDTPFFLNVINPVSTSRSKAALGAVGRTARRRVVTGGKVVSERLPATKPTLLRLRRALLG